ncbi:MAG: phosphodiester glycosidase family protein [Bacteroidota bacterium]
MKYRTLSKLSLVWASLWLAALTPSISVSQIKYDTLLSKPVGPGIVYTRIYVSSVPWNINVLEVDLKNPYIRIETAKAQDRLAGFERTSSMANRNTYDGHFVVGAINGDFYDTGTGIPINVQVKNGEILRRPIQTSTLGFDMDKRPSLSIVSFSGSLITSDTAVNINGVNEWRYTNALILYNSYMGSTTGTNQWGTEVKVHPLGEWFVNDTVACVVDTIVGYVGNMSIPKGGAVLSGHGVASTFLSSKLHKGDTVKIALHLTPSLAKLKEMLGGFPKIVFNGLDYVDRGYAEEGGPDHTYQRHPRTGAGISADSSKLYLITVDGRQAGFSVGMTLKELAALMIHLGVYHGINFDGGGSTTMVVRGSVVNSPSDPTERSVANALLVVSTARRDTVASSIEIKPKSLRIFKEETFRFSISVLDKYYNPLQVDSSKLQFTADPRIGTISPDGLFKAGSSVDSGYVIASYQNLRDSAFVVVKGLRNIVIAPRKVVTDTTRPVIFTVQAYDIDGMQRSVDKSKVVWSSTNAAVGIIDSNGVFHGRQSGSTFIAASYFGLTDTAEVSVQIGRGFALLDSIESTAGWSFTFKNVDPANTFVTLAENRSSIGQKSLKINYKFTYDLNPSYVYLNTQIPIYGVPDSLWIDVQADSLSHVVFFTVTDDDGGQFQFYSRVLASDSTKFVPIPAYASSSSSSFNYPITLTQIGVLLGGGVRRSLNKTYGGVIYVDNLRVSYPLHTTSLKEPEVVPHGFELYQNYPNPFSTRGGPAYGGNAYTDILFALPVRRNVVVRIFDVLGREVTTLINREVDPGIHQVKWNGKNQFGQLVPSGVYFYTLTAGNFTETRKMMLIR